MNKDSSIRICKHCNGSSSDKQFYGIKVCLDCRKRMKYETNKLNRLANKERYNTYQKEYQRS